MAPNEPVGAPPIQGVRILEIANETGEFAGKLLAGLGADVIKVEPPAGEVTRGIGPFYKDVVHPDRSLHFWHYNLGKRGVTLDLEVAEAREVLGRLLGEADVLLLARDAPYLDTAGLGEDAALRAEFPALIIARVTPFGRSGPYRDYRANDLVHLALGGHLALCGYDPIETPEGPRYDTPPIAV